MRMLSGHFAGGSASVASSYKILCWIEAICQIAPHSTMSSERRGSGSSLRYPHCLVQSLAYTLMTSEQEQRRSLPEELSGGQSGLPLGMEVTIYQKLCLLLSSRTGLLTPEFIKAGWWWSTRVDRGSSVHPAVRMSLQLGLSTQLHPGRHPTAPSRMSCTS